MKLEEERRKKPTPLPEKSVLTFYGTFGLFSAASACCCTHEDIVVGSRFSGSRQQTYHPPVTTPTPDFCGPQLAITVENLWGERSFLSWGFPSYKALLLRHHAHRRKSISSLMQNVTQLVRKIYTRTETHTHTIIPPPPPK